MNKAKNASPSFWNQAKIRRFRRSLLEWYEEEKRTLPWRSDPDPYKVWISEIMLQQTQVRTVLPYYERFIARFPNVQSLAAASEDEVLGAWAGLGYYARARNLHRAARRIAYEHGGKFPDSLDSLLQLPGIGRYTARAIRSIAFGCPEPVVDGNVQRVISRLFAIGKAVPESYFWARAESLVSRSRPSEFNQAMMDLGALVCTFRNPACGECPAENFCEARWKGVQNQLPSNRSLPAILKVKLVLLVVRRADKVLVTTRIPAVFVPGQYALPGNAVDDRVSPQDAAHDLAREMLLGPVKIRAGAVIRHSITFRRIAAHVFYTDCSGLGLNRSAHKNCTWVPRSEIDFFLTSALYRKALNSLNS